MVKAIYFIKRKHRMPLQHFRSYWLGEHARLVKRLPELRRYVQSHTLDSGYRTREPIYDGIAELWYDDTDSMRRAAATPEGAAAAADQANFIEPASFDFVITEEREMVAGAAKPGMAKMIYFLTRRNGLSVEEFQNYWASQHGPLAAKVPGVRRYVQSHLRRSAYHAGRNPRYDGVAETWFDDIDALRASAGTEEYRAVRADEANFLAPDTIRFIIAGEHVIV
jgi:uncharacterized protein (TIGR02118 family)